MTMRRQLDHEYRECFRIGGNSPSPLSSDSRFSDYLTFRSARVDRLISIDPLIQHHSRVADDRVREPRNRISIRAIFQQARIRAPSDSGKRVLSARLSLRSLYATLEISVCDEMLMKTTRQHEARR